MQSQYSFVQEVRGCGLIWAMELKRPAAPIVSACLQEGVLIITAGERVLRFLPPLIISPEQIDKMIAVLERVLNASPIKE